MDTQQNNTQKNIFSWHNVILSVVFFILGYISFDFIQKHNSNRPQENMDLFWQVWSTLEEKYPFAEPANQEKIYAAISGLVESYNDDYSVFFPPVDSEFFNQTIEGEFGGIGAEIGIRSGYLTIIAPLKNSPAEQSGVQSGDIITHVNGNDITGETLDQVITKIRGEIGTDVTLTLARRSASETIDITITRDTVMIPILETETIDDVFVIHLYNFNESSDREFKKVLREFTQQDKRKLLIDVRDNPGGYLTSAIDISSYFIPQGDIILREQHGENGDDETIYRSLGYELLDGMDYQVKVLTNYGSASASEILAGALQDHKIAEVVGETTYGKGSVQELVELPNDTSLKITVAKWLTPQGKHISETGVIPDKIIETELSSDETDIQLKKTIRYFR